MGTTRKALIGVCFAAPVADRASREISGAAAARARTFKTGEVDITLTGSKDALPDCAGIDRYGDVVAGAPTVAIRSSVDVTRRGKSTDSKVTLHGDGRILNLQLRP